jgi:hypothetical protein
MRNRIDLSPRARTSAWKVFLAAGVLLSSGWLPQSVAAPAPLARPKPAPTFSADDFVGAWQIEWGNGKGVCHFTRDGGYFEQWYGTAWQGTWQLVPTAGAGGAVVEYKLTVTEVPFLSDGTIGNPLTWTATLKPGLKDGILGDGGIFRLRSVEKAKPDA